MNSKRKKYEISINSINGHCVVSHLEAIPQFDGTKFDPPASNIGDPVDNLRESGALASNLLKKNFHFKPSPFYFLGPELGYNPSWVLSWAITIFGPRKFQLQISKKKLQKFENIIEFQKNIFLKCIKLPSEFKG